MVAALLRFPESCCGGGRHSGPLAREIPDIFRHGWRRAGKFRNDDVLGGLWGALLGIPDSCCGSGRHSGPLAREIPDIFRHGWRRAGKFRNDDRGGRWEVAGRSAGIKKIIVIPEFSAWLTFVLERCRAENIRNLPRQRAPTPLFPERRPREACSMPISGCHDLPLATFNLPSRVFRHGWRRAGCPE